MAEEVKVHISTDADTKGVDQTRAKIQELYKAATNYDAKGMDTAAKTARQDAQSLEKDLARHSRERATTEKEITREQRAQVQETGRLKRTGLRAMTVARDLATGQSPEGALNGLANSLPGVAGIVAGAVAAAAVVAGTVIRNKLADTQERIDNAATLREEGAGHERRRSILSGWRGGAAALQQSVFGDEDDIFEREQKRQRLSQEARRYWFNPLRLFGENTWAGQRAIDQNEAEIKQADKQRTADLAAQKKRFTEGEGGLELDAERQRARRSIAGYRSEFIDEEKLKWASKYTGFRNAGGDDDAATEMANLSMQNERRDRQVAAGAGLVDARSGGAEIAAAARWGQNAFAAPGIEEIKALHDTVRGGYEESQLKNLAK